MLPNVQTISFTDVVYLVVINQCSHILITFNNFKHLCKRWFSSNLEYYLRVYSSFYSFFNIIHAGHERIMCFM